MNRSNVHKQDRRQEQGEGSDGGGPLLPEDERILRIPTLPAKVRQEEEEAILVPLSAWERIRGRLEGTPRPSSLWLVGVGLFPGLAWAERDDPGLMIAFLLLSVICFLGYQALGKAAQDQRDDIAQEMRLHEFGQPPRAQRQRQAPGAKSRPQPHRRHWVGSEPDT